MSSQQDKPPTMAEIVEAMRTLQEPNNTTNVVTKNMVATICAGVVLALGAWMMSGLNQMQQSVTQVQTTVTALQHSVDALTTSGSVSVGEQSNMKTDIARLQQQVDQDTQRLDRLDGRGTTYGSPNQGGSSGSSAPRV